MVFAARKSEESFHAVFSLVAPRIMAYFRLRGCSPDVAEDYTQEVMLVLYRQAGTLRDHSRFRPWLYQIARNVLLQHLRRKGREVEVIHLEALVSEFPARGADPAWRSDFERWMAALDPEEQRIVTLRFVDGLEHHEIAELTGLPLGTVQWKVFQVKKKLAAHFGPGE